MLENYVLKKSTCTRYHQSMAGPHLDSYVDWLSAQGYQYQTIRRLIRGAVQFAQWCENNELDIEQMGASALSEFGSLLASQHLLKSVSGSYLSGFRGARHFQRFLCESGIVPVCNEKQASAFPILFQEFQSWMSIHRGVTTSTLDGYRAIVLDLLARIGDQPNSYTTKSLREFVLHRVHNHNKSSAQNVISATRMFLRFLVVSGRLNSGLEDSIPNMAAWRLHNLPRSLPTNVVDAVISSCDSTTVVGARNRAIFLLLSQLGLRAGEVAALRFGDIDWHSATVNIHDKCRREARLPLPQIVGDALLSYLENFRPVVSIEQVFISTLAPHRPLRRVSISQLATQALRRAGVTAPTLGAHMFRHSIATTLLAEGVSLQTIATLLRHTSLESTRLYASVDQSMLREVALEWPEVAPC